jgi:hypothetical protein
MAGLQHPVTLDGRYFVVRGRLWRGADPNLDPERKLELVRDLMRARRAVKESKSSGNLAAEAAAHKAVDVAKRALASAVPFGGAMDRQISTGTRRRTACTRLGMLRFYAKGAGLSGHRSL